MRVDSQKVSTRLIDTHSPFLSLLGHGTLAADAYKLGKTAKLQPYTCTTGHNDISGTLSFLTCSIRTIFHPVYFILVSASEEHRLAGLTGGISTKILFYESKTDEA